MTSLLRSEARLVTLTGAGGSGKTRLALEAAAEVVGDYPNGVYWVALAPLRDARLVLETVAQTAGAKEELATHFAGKHALLLLDNFEQVVEAAPALSELLSTCQGLECLVTSRELLRITGEQEYSVSPLDDDEAVKLFCERSHLEPTEEIADLCRRLDKLPLALELAAARANVLSPEQIRDRLSSRLDLLKGGRDAEARHQTLRATIEWSYALLTEEEQRLFARLSIFAGGCTLQAAEEVCDADIDTLSSLVDKSLVRKTGERFWMLETIREYADQLLSALGEAGEARRAHAAYFLGYANSLGLNIESYEAGAKAQHELAIVDQENLRAAMDWGLDADPQLGLRLANALEQFWVANSPFEGARRLESLLARVDAPVELLAHGLRCYGTCLNIGGDPERAKLVYQKSLGLYERIGDEWAILNLRNRLGAAALVGGDWATARSLFEENLARAKTLGSLFLEGEALSLLGSVEDHDGNAEKGFELVHRSLELTRAAGFKWREAIDLGNLAQFSIELGRLADAEEYGRAGLELARRMGDRLTTVSSLATLALVARAQGDAARAGRLWGAIEAEEARSPLGRWGSYRDEFAAQLLTAADAGFEDGRTAGRLDSLDAATQFALSVDSKA